MSSVQIIDQIFVLQLFDKNMKNSQSSSRKTTTNSQPGSRQKLSESNPSSACTSPSIGQRKDLQFTSEPKQSSIGQGVHNFQRSYTSRTNQSGRNESEGLSSQPASTTQTASSKRTLQKKKTNPVGSSSENVFDAWFKQKCNDANLDTKKMPQSRDDGQTMSYKIRPQREVMTESEFLEESLLQTEQSLMDAEAPGGHSFAAQMSNNPASMEIQNSMSADELEKIKQKLAKDYMLVSALQNSLRADPEQNYSPNTSQKTHEEKKYMKSNRSSEGESGQESTEIQSKGTSESNRRIQNSYGSIPFGNTESHTKVVKTKKTYHTTTMDVDLGSFPGVIQPGSTAVRKNNETQQQVLQSSPDFRLKVLSMHRQDQKLGQTKQHKFDGTAKANSKTRKTSRPKSRKEILSSDIPLQNSGKSQKYRKFVPGQTQKFENVKKKNQKSHSPLDYDHEKYQQLGTKDKLNQLMGQKQDTPTNSSGGSQEQSISPDRPMGQGLVGSISGQNQQQLSSFMDEGLDMEESLISQSQYNTNETMIRKPIYNEVQPPQLHSQRKQIPQLDDVQLEEVDDAFFNNFERRVDSRTFVNKHEIQKKSNQTKKLALQKQSSVELLHPKGSKQENKYASPNRRGMSHTQNQSFLRQFHETQQHTPVNPMASPSRIPRAKPTDNQTSLKKTNAFLKNVTSQSLLQSDSKIKTLTKVKTQSGLAPKGLMHQQNQSINMLQQKTSNQPQGAAPLKKKFSKDLANTAQNNLLPKVQSNVVVAQQPLVPNRTPSNSRLELRKQKYTNFKSKSDANVPELATEESKIGNVLQFLLQEEEVIYQLATLAKEGNFQEMSLRGFLLQRHSIDYSKYELYSNLLIQVNVQKQRPRVFATQLNMYILMASMLVEVLVLHQPTMRKFASKLNDVFNNCHQNFLLMIDLILDSCNVNPTQNLDYVILRKVIVKKLVQKQKLNRLTAFRQNNELSRAFLKRISIELTDSSIAKGSMQIQDLANLMIESLRFSVHDDEIDAMKTPDADQRVLGRFEQLHNLAIGVIDSLKLSNKKIFLNNANQASRQGQDSSGNIEKRYKSAIRGGNRTPAQNQVPRSGAQKDQALKHKLKNLYSSESQDEQDRKSQRSGLMMTSSDRQEQQLDVSREHLQTVEEQSNLPEESPGKLALQLQESHSSPGQSARVLQSKDRRDRRDQDIAEKLESPIPKGEIIPLRQPVDESDGEEIDVNEQDQRQLALTDRYPDRETGNYKPPLPPKSSSITSVTKEIPLRIAQLPTKIVRSPNRTSAQGAGANNQSSFAQKKAQLMKDMENIRKQTEDEILETNKRLSGFSISPTKQVQGKNQKKQEIAQRLTAQSTQNIQQSSQGNSMILPENLAFLLGAIQGGAQVSVNVTQSQDPKRSEVTNINNNINFYGPVTLPQNETQANIAQEESPTPVIQPSKKPLSKKTSVVKTQRTKVVSQNLTSSLVSSHSKQSQQSHGSKSANKQTKEISEQSFSSKRADESSNKKKLKSTSQPSKFGRPATQRNPLSKQDSVPNQGQSPPQQRQLTGKKPVLTKSPNDQRKLLASDQRQRRLQTSQEKKIPKPQKPIQSRKSQGSSYQQSQDSQRTFEQQKFNEDGVYSIQRQKRQSMYENASSLESPDPTFDSIHRFASGNNSFAPTEEGRPSLASEEADQPLFISPRASQRPQKEQIEGLEKQMEDQVSRKGQKLDEEELNVISPRDIRDDDNIQEESIDAEAELTMTDIEHGQNQLNDTEYQDMMENEEAMTAKKPNVQHKDEYETDNITQSTPHIDNLQQSHIKELQEQFVEEVTPSHFQNQSPEFPVQHPRTVVQSSKKPEIGNLEEDVSPFEFAQSSSIVQLYANQRPSKLVPSPDKEESKVDPGSSRISIQQSIQEVEEPMSGITDLSSPSPSPCQKQDDGEFSPISEEQSPTTSKFEEQASSKEEKSSSSKQTSNFSFKINVEQVAYANKPMAQVVEEEYLEQQQYYNSDAQVFEPAPNIAEEIIQEVESGLETTQRDTITHRTKQYQSDFVTPREPPGQKGGYVTPMDDSIKKNVFGYESSDIRPKRKNNAYESSDYEVPKAPKRNVNAYESSDFGVKKVDSYVSSSDFEPPHKKGQPYFSTSEIEAKNVNVYDSSTDNHTLGKPTPREGFAEQTPQQFMADSSCPESAKEEQKNSDFFVDDIEEDIIVTKHPLKVLNEESKESEQSESSPPFLAAIISNPRVSSLLFEEETLAIKEEMERQKKQELAEKQQQRISMRMTGPNRKKKFHESKRFSMEYGEDATPLAHRFSGNNRGRNKTLKIKREGVKNYASPFMGQEKSNSAVVGIASNEEVLKSANMLRSATMDVEIDSPSAFGSGIEANQMSILSIATRQKLSSNDTPKESLMTSISRAKQSDLKKTESKDEQSPIQPYVKKGSRKRTMSVGESFRKNNYYSSQQEENEITPRQSQNEHEKGESTMIPNIEIPSPTKGNPLKNRSRSLSDFREWAAESPARRPTIIVNHVEQNQVSHLKPFEEQQEPTSAQREESKIQLTTPFGQQEKIIQQTEEEIEEQDGNNNQLDVHEKTPGFLSSSHMVEHDGEDTSDEEQAQIDAQLKLLRSQVTIPYLPPLSEEDQAYGNVYTLVLDLDETLIHFDQDDDDEEGCYFIRPGAIKFLKEMCWYYEVVVFTAAMPDYADWILDNLDEHGVMIKHRLYRQHTTPTEDYAIKDLTKIGRPLERVIIVDNLAENFLYTTPNNGIWVESWYDDMHDQVLPNLEKFLGEIVEKQVPDVRELLTQEIKENIVYTCLERNKPIPPVEELLEQAQENEFEDEK